MKTIKVTIKPTGESVIEVISGFAGKECLKATKSLEDALGKVSKRKETGGDAKELEVINTVKSG